MPVIARMAMVTGDKRRGAAGLKRAPQAVDLAPPQAGQDAGVGDTQTAGLNPGQNLETGELLLAHRHHRHGTPLRTLKPGAVPSQLCGRVASLYCAYTSNTAEYILYQVRAAALQRPTACSFIL